MIYTVTFNPSLDYIVRVAPFVLGQVNRSSEEMVFAGGKGINVSLVLKNLGLESVALGFVAGFTGSEIERRLQEKGCHTDFIHLERGMSRINVKIGSDTETEINGRGPVISPKALEALFQRFSILNEEDILVISGSIPSCLPNNIYEKILALLKDKGIRIAVDATGELLLHALPYQPYLIKPNHVELGEMFGVSLNSSEEVKKYAKKLQEMGARNVLISMAGNGALLLSENGKVYESAAPKGRAVNSVGAGDSMVAGFIAGMEESGDYETAFYMGIASGSASAFSKGLAEKAEALRLYHELIKK